MCYGHVDQKVLEREVADRMRAAASVPEEEARKDPILVEAFARLKGLFAGRGGVVASE